MTDPAEPSEFTVGEPAPERWLVPFVVIPLAIAGTVLGIVGLVYFLVGGSGARSADELLQQMLTGGANTRKQAAFALARDLTERVEKQNAELKSKEGWRPEPHAVLRRQELAKIERAYEIAKGDPETRTCLIGALGLTGDEESVDFLARQLANPDEPDEGGARKVQLLLALARIGSPHAIPTYRSQLEISESQPDPGIVLSLAAAFANVATAEGTAGLKSVDALARGHGSSSGTDGHRWLFVRWTVAVNLAKRKEIDPEAAKGAIPVLLEALDDISRDPFRPEAERRFGRGVPAGPLGVRSSTLQADTYRESSTAQVIEALVLLRAAEAVPLLEKVAAEDPSFRMRSFALEALKKLKS